MAQVSADFLDADFEVCGLCRGGGSVTMKAVSANCKNKDPDGGRQMDADRIAPNGEAIGKEWSF